MADRPEDATDEALIAYVRGTLPRQEADRIEAEAGRDPELAADIALTRGIAAALDEQARESAPGQLGWARLSRALDAETVRPERGRRPVWQLAASAAAAVLVWQAVAVPILSPPAEQPGYAPVTEQPAGDFSVAVAFAPAATEQAIRTLIREIDARVSDGPSAIGLWRLSFASAAARDAGLARLQVAAIVESAQAQ
jgi:anti-sigma-K factor RskA